MDDFIYLDNAATTYMNKNLVELITPYDEDKFYNPYASYSLSTEIKIDLENARIRIAKALQCKRQEIFFTSSATEANNWAIKGIAFKMFRKGKHIITSSIEHMSILESCKFLENNGFDITYLPVDEYGVVSISELIKCIRKDTILISIMSANNEIGTLQPICEIGEIAAEKNIPFHSDMVQSIGQSKINLHENNISLMSMSGHKICGPKGIGMLYIKEHTAIEPLIHGGGQELSLRSGTENVSGCIGLSYSLEKVVYECSEKSKKLMKLRDEFIEKIISNISHVKLNGHYKRRLPNNINMSFREANGKLLVRRLDDVGIMCSTVSACSSCGGTKEYHVLRAIGLTEDWIANTVRFSINEHLTSKQIDFCVKMLKEIVEEVRGKPSIGGL